MTVLTLNDRTMALLSLASVLLHLRVVALLCIVGIVAYSVACDHFLSPPARFPGPGLA